MASQRDCNGEAQRQAPGRRRATVFERRRVQANAAERGWDRNVALTFLANFVGTTVIFALGVAWLSTIMGGFEKAVIAGFQPFIVGAIVKIALAATILPLVWKLLPRR